MSHTLSEKKGVIMWLKNKGKNDEFAGYLLKIFYQQTNISFYRITFTCFDNTRFQKFTTWYGLQDINKLLKDYKIYKTEKQNSKQRFLENYYNSDWHNFFMGNQNNSTNELYKQFKNKIPYGEFKALYKKSKLKFDSVS